MNYPSINMKLTGQKIKRLLSDAGYDVKTIQNYLHLSCPQPIYRWMSGKALPSVDHLYALSVLLGVHMEELIVSEQSWTYENVRLCSDRMVARLYCYYERLKQCA